MDIISTIFSIFWLAVFGFIVYAIYKAYTNYKKCGMDPICMFTGNKGECPEGSKSTGLTCIQANNAYIPSNKSKNPFNKDFYCSDDCTGNQETVQKVGCVHTCADPCLPGFTARSYAAGTGFCDKPRYS